MKARKAKRLIPNFTLAFLALSIADSVASPRIDSDSISARHDMQLLKDGRAINSAILTWPWPLGRKPFREPNADTSGSEKSYNRIADRYEKEETLGYRPIEASIAVGTDHQPFRSFGYQPREELEASISTSWLSEWTAGKLKLSYANNPLDGDEIRLDGSYLSLALGNWAVSLDQVERWWGPGWDGTLLLSNAARPVPALSLTRISPEPWENKWLKWIGPWTFNSFMGQLDNDEGDFDGSDALLFGMRIDFSPFGWENLDIGLNRTAQWAGDGRPSGFGTFRKLFLGEDNRVPGSNVNQRTEPGNQLAGVDWRLRYFDWNFASYGQIVGEDEETYLPDANMLLFGAEYWGELEDLNATYRLFYEWADTRAGHLLADPDSPLRQNKAFNIAYNHSIYSQGYRRKGMPMGHAIDGDGLMKSLGGFIVSEDGNLWGTKLRKYSINRDGLGPNSVSIDPLDGWSAQVFAELKVKSEKLRMLGNREFGINLGLHYIKERNIRTGETDEDVGGYLSLTKKL